MPEQLEIPDQVVAGRGAQPFLKWAGGKSQLIAQFEPFFPRNIDGYIDPFVGGGALFFHLKARFPRLRAALCDVNPELVNCYRAVRDDPQALMTRLDAHLREFRTERRDYYYQVRSQHQQTDSVERAARMIFLNKTCFNGLWRVNSRGEFNVPIGSYPIEKVSLYNPGNLMAASRALARAELRVQDFQVTLASAQTGDFVYIDPPYNPVSTTASFTSYTKEDFGEEAQRELANSFAKAAQRGVRLLLSNSDTPLIRELYQKFPIHTVKARRSVNSDASKRGLVSEVVVLGGPC